MNYASSNASADTVVASITAAGGKAVAVGSDFAKAAEANGYHRRATFRGVDRDSISIQHSKCLVTANSSTFRMPTSSSS